jgi:hypothetical protein
MTDPVYITGQHSPDPQAASVECSCLSQTDHFDKLFFNAQACNTASPQGERIKPIPVAEFGSELDPIFVSVIQMWNAGADTNEIATELQLPESSAHWLANHYLGLKYAMGWGARA